MITGYFWQIWVSARRKDRESSSLKSRFKFRRSYGFVERKSFCLLVCVIKRFYHLLPEDRFFLDSKKSDFGLPPDINNDFKVNEVQDMISVIQRMIKDGKPIKYWKYRDYSMYLSMPRNVQEKYICVSKFLRKKKKKEDVVCVILRILSTFGWERSHTCSLKYLDSACIFFASLSFSLSWEIRTLTRVHTYDVAFLYTFLQMCNMFMPERDGLGGRWLSHSRRRATLLERSSEKLAYHVFSRNVTLSKLFRASVFDRSIHRHTSTFSF